jgi:hypothetical protein
MRFTLLTIALLTTIALQAQGVGEIRGFAWDSDGKPVAGAKIELSGDSSQTVTAAADGSFAFPNLPVGHYRIAASEEKRQIVSEVSVSVNLTAGQTLQADVTVGTSIRHYPRWKRILMRLDGISH